MKLPSKTTSFAYWAKRLNEYAVSDAVRQEADFWLDMVAQPVASLPSEVVDEGANAAAGVEGVADAASTNPSAVGAASGRAASDAWVWSDYQETITAMSAEETARLLNRLQAGSDGSSSDGRRMPELLLTALTLALQEWTGGDTMLYDVVRHGREDIFADLDVSRTVGWFANHSPFVATVKDGGVASNLAHVAAQFDRVPNNGIGYGLLRYLGDDANLRDRLAVMAHPEVRFKYNGRTAPYRDAIVETSIGLWSGDHQENVPYLLYCQFSLAGDRLELYWVYNKRIHREETIRLVRDRMIGLLREYGCAGEGR